jgi:predicted metallopeptidase
MKWIKADELKKEAEDIAKKLELSHLDFSRIFFFKTIGAKTRAYARIWSFPKIFQRVLNVEPAYVVEIISENFEKLSKKEKAKVIIHELLHIPKNFSGSLLPHTMKYKKINKEAEKLVKKL